MFMPALIWRSIPVAHQADEILAYPISAPSATHWAGLAGPGGIDLDDGHAFEGGLVLDLTMNLASRPRGESTVHPTRPTACAAEGKVLEDNCCATILGELHESF